MDSRRNKRELAFVSAAALALLLLMYVGVFFLVSKRQPLSNGPAGVREFRNFPNRLTYEAYRLLWLIEHWVHGDREAAYQVR
jgi:hypothetical protein